MDRFESGTDTDLNLDFIDGKHRLRSAAAAKQVETEVTRNPGPGAEATSRTPDHVDEADEVAVHSGIQ